MAREKILWVVGYNKLDDFLRRAVNVGATGVAIRSDNNLAQAIDKFHAKQIKVFGWRWPSARRDPCLHEAEKIAALLGRGLDGYFVDPEGEHGKPYDWDQSGLAPLAEQFCRTVTSAAPNKPFGTTSHYRANKLFPKLPWKAFFKFSSVLLPQAYWRTTSGTVGHGIPADNYRVSLDFWEKAGGDRDKIVPMAGELGSVTAPEIRAHVKEAVAQGRDTLHFYTYESHVKESVWRAVAEA